MIVRVALAVLAACSAPPKPELGNTAPHAGPSPLVARGGRYGLTTEHVPAIAADGSRIVAAVRDSDGERGLPNLTLVVKNRRDEEVARHVVLSLAEADTMQADAEGNNPALDARVARANAWLAELRFEAMLLLDPETTELPFERTKAARDGVTIRWEKSHLQILDGAHVLVDRPTPPSWLPESTCPRTAYLGAAAISRVHALAVVTISYVSDSDFCLPPPDQHHVVVW